MIIKGDNIDDVLYQVCKQLTNAKEYDPRHLKTKELVKPQLIIENPEYCVVTNPARKLSIEYLKAEMEWYKLGTRKINFIKKFSSMWEKLVDKNGDVNSNYGEIAFKQKMRKFSGSQFDWVVESLKKDKDSRQAIINFNQPKHKDMETKDFVCTTNIQYLIRDNKLLSFTDMRSNDLIYGFCFDFPFFSYLHQKVFDSLKESYPELELGYNIHTSTSLHVYERHFEMINNIITEYEKEKPLSKKLKDVLNGTKTD